MNLEETQRKLSEVEVDRERAWQETRRARRALHEAQELAKAAQEALFEVDRELSPEHREERLCGRLSVAMVAVQQITQVKEKD